MENFKDMSLEDKLNYLDENKDKLFSNAIEKTKRDECGRIIISKSEENAIHSTEEGFIKWE